MPWIGEGDDHAEGRMVIGLSILDVQPAAKTKKEDSKEEEKHNLYLQGISRANQYSYR